MHILGVVNIFEERWVSFIVYRGIAIIKSKYPFDCHLLFQQPR